MAQGLSLVGFGLVSGFQIQNLRLVAFPQSLSQFFVCGLVLLELLLTRCLLCRQFCFPFFSNFNAYFCDFLSEVCDVLLGQRLELDLKI